MKEVVILITAGLVITGCCSTPTDLQRWSTSDLQLRRYDLVHCLSVARTSWDKGPVPNNTDDDVRADLQEKAAVEREIARRGVTAYNSPPSMTEQYVHERCHCQSWVINF